MKVFVWEDVSHASDGHHSRGGVVVFAETETRAREIVNKDPECKIEPTEKPNYVRNLLEGGDEKVFIFPDRGCC